MLNLIKRCLVILTLALIISSISLAVVPQSQYFYVNDTANVLSQSLEDYIINTNVELNSKTDAQIVVVTVNNLEGQSIEKYSTDLFRQYGIGDKTKNNGVLLIVSIQDRKVRIEVGYGLEGRLNDGKCGRILDNYVTPYFKDNNWEKGIEEGFNAILSEVSEEYDVSLDTINKNFSYDSDSLEDDDFILVFFGLSICAMFGIIISLISVEWYIRLASRILVSIIVSTIIWIIGVIILNFDTDFLTILSFSFLGSFMGLARGGRK